VPIDTGIGVSIAVPDPDVESGAALLPRARRTDPLHCGGGCIFSYWAPLPAEPVMPRMTLLVDIGQRYCSGQKFMSRTVVSISAIDSLAHHCIAAMIVRVYGSLVTQRISGGQLLVLERVLADERFTWGLTLHAWMVVQLDHCRSTSAGEFSFGSILVAWFLERVPMLRPRILLEVSGAREPWLRQWSTVLLRHGGGKGGHFFSREAAQVWR
jgi:hypothetical protein